MYGEHVHIWAGDRFPDYLFNKFTLTALILFLTYQILSNEKAYGFGHIVVQTLFLVKHYIHVM